MSLSSFIPSGPVIRTPVASGGQHSGAEVRTVARHVLDHPARHEIGPVGIEHILRATAGADVGQLEERAAPHHVKGATGIDPVLIARITGQTVVLVVLRAATVVRMNHPEVADDPRTDLLVDEPHASFTRLLERLVAAFSQFVVPQYQDFLSGLVSVVPTGVYPLAHVIASRAGLRVNVVSRRCHIFLPFIPHHRYIRSVPVGRIGMP